ncbi:unnamed protein product [Oppiella nova]|uniref:OTU domain-containing protein n=1 Tax=Oppiella nova TaxID=334625 RepID=A0A7R9QLM7_9ACAR|nr:unnamed protein product [Oppiella nova]CAG2168072.1 unnamed protein product [Oppiella nova]
MYVRTYGLDEHVPGSFKTQAIEHCVPYYSERDVAYGVTDNRKSVHGKTYADTVNVQAIRERVDREDRARYEQALQEAKREKANQRPIPKPDYNSVNEQGTYDPQLEQALQMSKIQSKWDSKRRLETEWQTKNKLKETAKTELQEKLYRIVSTELYTPEKLMEIKRALGEYETTTGTTIFDTCQISDLHHKDLNDTSSTALYGDYSRMESLRVITATTLIKHQGVFEKYMDEQRVKYGYNHELSFEGLVRAAVDLQVWGDELHVMALSLALHRPIYSYGSLRLAFDTKSPKHYEELKEAYERQTIQNHFRYIADENNIGAQPILLYYNGRDHYSVVLPVRDDVVALVPQMQLLEPIFKRRADDQDLIVLDEPKNDKSDPDDNLNNNEITESEIPVKTTLTLNKQEQSIEPKLNNPGNKENQDKMIDLMKREFDKQINELTQKMSTLNAHIIKVNSENSRFNEHVRLLSDKCSQLQRDKLTWTKEKETYQDENRKLFNRMLDLDYQLKQCMEGELPGSYTAVNNGGLNANDVPINGLGINGHNGNISKSINPDNICWVTQPNPTWVRGIDNGVKGVNYPRSFVNPPPGMSGNVYPHNNHTYIKQINTENVLDKNNDKIQAPEPMQTDM